MGAGRVSTADVGAVHGGHSTGVLPALLIGVALLGLVALVAGCAGTAGPALPAASDERLPIVFVHGNGDSSALWQTTLWRFESNGWPSARLHAIDMPYPTARDNDAQPQPGRSSTADSRDFLAAEIDRVLAASGARQVVLVGSSRGGYAIRSYVANGGAPRVAKVVLGGTPNHGVWANDTNPGSEFNGRGAFLTALNGVNGPDSEVTPGPQWLTLRSDNNDKFAQPMGGWIGRPNEATNVGFDGPALKGARNVVLAGLDHREVAFHPLAFAETWRFVTGTEPARTEVLAEPRVVLNGRVAALQGAAQTNLPLAGARVDIFEVQAQSGERIGNAMHTRAVGVDGLWGPFAGRPDAAYEFVVAAPGYATLHIYRAPFLRSSSVVHLRAVRMADADRTAGAVVTMTRPRGYFDTRRDRMLLDGKPLPGIPPGVAGVSASRLVLPDGPPRSVLAEFNGQRIAVRTWPARDDHVVFAELHD